MDKKSCKSCGKIYTTEQDYLNDTSSWKLCEMENLWFNCSCGSTLVLRKGKYPWYSPSLNMTDSAASLFNELSKKNSIPYMKNSTMKIQQLLSREEPDLDEIANSLRNNPIIAGELLETTRRLNRGEESSQDIKDIKHAVLYVGTKKLRDMILLASIKEIKLEAKSFNINQFWENSFSNAIILEYLTKKFTPYHNPDEMYLTGFLMDIGKFIQAYYFPQEVDKLIKQKELPSNLSSWSDLESSVNLDSYLLLGEIGAAIWGLPQNIVDCCNIKNLKVITPGQYITKPALASFASQLNHRINYETNEVDQNIIQNVGKKLSLAKQDIDNLSIFLRQYVDRFTLEQDSKKLVS